ncbi:MAG: FG-GAP repeat domain-containing protein [Candidatus Bipolaricaulia bacterium]
MMAFCLRKIWPGLLFLLAGGTFGTVFPVQAQEGGRTQEGWLPGLVQVKAEREPEIRAGTGTTSRADTALVGISGGDTAIGDVNNDGHPDLLITGNASPTRSRPRTMLYLNGKGAAFREVESALPTVMGGAVAVGDIGSDGHLDLLLTGGRPEGRIATLYLGDGHGHFSEAGAELTGVAGGSVSIGDVDRDGHLDLLITGRRRSRPNRTAGSPTATLYLGDGEGEFAEAAAGLGGVARSASAVGDVNGDGTPDLLIAGTDTSGAPSTTLYLANGSGGFTAANAGLTGLTEGSASIGDLNGDGHADLLLTGRSVGERPSTELYLGSAEGTFARAEAGLPDVVAGATALGDVNEDGTTDLLITGEGPSGASITRIYFGGERLPLSQAGASLAGVSFSTASMADMNGDGHLDLLITGEGRSGRPTTRLYIGNGNGDFSVRR